METKFNINRAPLSDEEINSKKDFGELINKFKKQSIEKAKTDANFFKNKKVTYSTIIAGVAVVCTVTYFSVFKNESSKNNANDKIITSQSNHIKNNTNKSFITPPISQLNIPYTAYKISATKGATIKHKTSNSKIIIPQKAFINKQGQEIIGDVEIQYREFHNQADIIASGIPMNYDSAGVKYYLESAGMFDIKGYKNGEPIFINPKKQITIEFSSKYTDDKFNMYELDTIKRNWTYLSRDNSIRNIIKNKKNEDLNIHSESPISKKINEKINTISPKIENEKMIYSKKVNQLTKLSEPLKPSKLNTNKPQFELDVNYKDFPELSAFKNAVFEIGSENKNYDSKLPDITWNSAEISEGPVKGKNYILTLSLKNRIEKLIVYPVLSEKDYETAMGIYETKFNEYKKLLAKKEAEEKKLKEEFEAKQASYIAEIKKLTEEKIKENIKYWKEQEEKLNTQFNTINAQEKVTRIFQISRFNIYNSDCPSNLPRESKLNPIYVINNSFNLTPVSVYLISHNRNLVYNLPNGPIPYNSDELYSICIFSNNKLYICDKNIFSTILKNKQNKIPLIELSKEVNNSYELKKALGI